MLTGGRPGLRLSGPPTASSWYKIVAITLPRGPGWQPLLPLSPLFLGMAPGLWLSAHSGPWYLCSGRSYPRTAHAPPQENFIEKLLLNTRGVDHVTNVPPRTDTRGAAVCVVTSRDHCGDNAGDYHVVPESQSNNLRQLLVPKDTRGYLLYKIFGGYWDLCCCHSPTAVWPGRCTALPFSITTYSSACNELENNAEGQ